MFKCIPIFRGDRHVELIDKRHCSLPMIPEDIFRYSRTLEELFLDANHIRILPKGLFRLTKLRKLTLSDNEISQLPPEIGNLVQLIELNVSKNEIVDIPDTIKNLKQLQIADFSSNPVQILPMEFSQLRALKSLALNDISLQQLPNNFGSLINLESLELRDNLIKKLPPTLSMLVHLERLDLGANDFTELPEMIGQLPNLQELWLDQNELSTLPKDIGRLKRLTCLDVSDNRLEYLPEEIAGCESLTDLHLSQNLLESLPDGIGQLNRLTILKIDQNRLESLNPTIGGCSCLQELILTENKLNDLPPTIGNLVHLTNFNVDRNFLREIPSQIGNLTRLGVLSFRENQLTHVPSEIGQLKELRVLDISGNHINYLPFSITALNLKALWLAENQSQPLLKFQTDFDEKSGQKVLTCFLLPQQDFANELQFDAFVDNNLERVNSINWDQPRHSAVQFDVQQDDDEMDDDSDPLISSNSGNEPANFVRHDTPHPKELKARHLKLFANKNLHNDVEEAAPAVSKMPQQQRKRSSETETDLNRSEQIESNVDQSDDNGEQFVDFQRNDLSNHKNDESMGSRSSIIINNDIADENDSRAAVNTNHQSFSFNNKAFEDIAPIDSPKSIDNSIDYQTKEIIDRVQRVNIADESDEKKTSNISVTKNRHVGFENNLNEIHTNYFEENSNDDDNDEEQEDRPVEKLSTKLHRRDTPHHLKNKRIHSSKEEKEKLVNILSTSVKNQNMSTEKQSSLKTETIFKHQLRLKLKKIGQSMGLSIAGGLGSSPYKGDDEGIFVSRVTENGSAEIAGLKIGDKILAVNNHSFDRIDHHEAVQVLKSAGEEFWLQVEREGTDSNSQKQVQIQSVAAKIPPIPPVRTSVISKNSNDENLTANTQTYLHSSETVAKPQQEPINKPSSLTRKEAENSQPISNNSTATSSKPIPTKLNLNRFSSGDIGQPLGKEIIYTTLIRSDGGLGFSINGGKSNEANDEPDCVYISRIFEGGPADIDGKLKVGDKILSINGISCDGLDHDQVISIITGLERFVRLVVEREGPINENSLPYQYSSSLNYSSNSYMANRPSYTGSYRRPLLGSVSSLSHGVGFDNGWTSGTISTPSTPSFTHSGKPLGSIFNAKLPGLRGSTDSNAYPPTSIYNYRYNSSQPKSSTINSRFTTSALNSNSTSSTREGSKSTSDANSIIHENHNGIASKFSNSRSASVPRTMLSSGESESKSLQLKQPTVVSKEISNNKSVTSELPPASNDLGVFTEVLTKTTYTENTVTRVTNNKNLPLNEETINVLKGAEGGLGLSIIGGSDHTCHPFGNGGKDHGIYVSKVVTGGPVAQTQKIRTGDRILNVNGRDLTSATHEEAVKVLTSCPPNTTITITVRHEPLPSGWRELIINKLPNEKLGMKIKGGAQGQPGNPFDREDEGIFISQINPNGAAARDGRLKPGMRIIEVNDQSLLGVPHQQAVQELRNQGLRLRLLICDGYDHDSIVNYETNINGNTKINSNSNHNQKDSTSFSSSSNITSPETPTRMLSGEDDEVFTPTSPSKEHKTTTVIMKKHQTMSSPSLSKTLPLTNNHSNNQSASLSATDRIKSPDKNKLDEKSPALDPFLSSKIPGAKPPIPPKKPDLSIKDKMTPNTKKEHPEWMSFSEKKRHFERTTSPDGEEENNNNNNFTKHYQKESTTIRSENFGNNSDVEISTKETIKKVQSLTKQSRELIFKDAEELQRFKENELKKFSSSIEPIGSYRHSGYAEEINNDGINNQQQIDEDGEDDENDDHFDPNPSKRFNEKSFKKEKTTTINTNDSETIEYNNRIFRTAKAEKRYIDKMLAMGIDIDAKDYSNLSDAQRKALEAEKRREWRQARLQSLEEDARQTLIQMQQQQQQNFNNSRENIVKP
ncbi:Protein lap4 [Sarcoptes scabiei]|uniref:Protein lap4 n=1 Tax=Sarcoptes scabiei TaxID=52283 RepID=A0A834RD38_SARSC|nr:Protein lap4 [Sarcoptes scabiei]